MKIGLVGAPGSGKTEFAHSLARALDAKPQLTPVTIVDNYVDAVASEADLACGLYGSYVADVSIAMARIGAERTLERDGAQTIITCGTLIDTTVHSAVNFTLAGGDWAWSASTVLMPFYSLLATSALDYDYFVYLALPAEEEASFATVVDQHLAPIAKEFGKTLISPDALERLL